MNTHFYLMAEFEMSDVRLSDISEKYFGLAPATARMRASAGRLPVPAYRETQKSEYLVNLHDLAEWIDRKRAEAKESMREGE
ncbi:pyocin activator protein PrtN [Agarivorans sp. B2Z047]|uniref:pyocin activator PrtN family protein n=1 Tax=Agarivorans sp. B2Z047 TaxID=2652721 RepID=UPI00128C060F|nr:pyocin activator PrtN family protein [Agarivorans sp. B2Z047]MPW28245.1 pyocin activator protein PrtN [Agarivorans sp. B2Z047]UQN43926.1 pyocin activator PrtN family protein [Agarivorans sp. B2Z047]